MEAEKEEIFCPGDGKPIPSVLAVLAPLIWSRSRSKSAARKDKKAESPVKVKAPVPEKATRGAKKAESPVEAEKPAEAEKPTRGGEEGPPGAAEVVECSR